MVTIDFIVKRHGEKESVPGLVSSTPQDRAVPLSEKGIYEERRFGEEHIPFPHYNHVIGITSDYLRAQETLRLNLFGGGYNVKNGQSVTTVARSDIGLGVNNHDKGSHPEMPTYGSEPDVLNVYVRTLFEKFWHARPGNPPCLAAYAAAMMDAIGYGIERTKRMPLPDDARVLVEIVTHCPVIDAAAYALVGKEIFEKGAFQTGEFFTGKYELGPEDREGKRKEQVVWSIKGMEKLHKGRGGYATLAEDFGTSRGLARDARTIVP